MKSGRTSLAVLILGGLALIATTPAKAEVIEEIVAKVNDDIITSSELDREEQMMTSELYRRFTGQELDEQIKAARSMLLQTLIDRRILVHRAGMLFDLHKMEDVILEMFMKQQEIGSMDELRRLLDQEGSDVADLKRRLINTYAPDEVIRTEVLDRVAVGDKEVKAYYEANPDEFTEPAEATLLEIVLLADTEERRQERQDEARRIHERVTVGGEDFGTVAGEVSEAASKDSGGRIGPFRKGDLAPPLERAAFSLAIGEVSEPIETEHGLHIIKVDSRSEERLEGFEEVRDQIKSQLSQVQLQEKLSVYLKKARNEADIWISPKYKERYLPDNK